MVDIRHINNSQQEIEIVRDLFLEYSKGLNENLCFQSFDDELQDPLKKYGEPRGSLLLAYEAGEPAGCIALQPLKPEGVCEMKRLYVRPRFRGKGIAGQLVTILLAEAKEKGYRKMVLDTLERLQPAITLYTKFGFKNTSAYYHNPLAHAVYMEIEL